MGLSRFVSHQAGNSAVAAELTPGIAEASAVSAGELATGLAVPADSQVAAPTGADGQAATPKLEPRLVKESFAGLMSQGPAAMQYFYARLFAANPDSRALFPSSMTAQRERMFSALARIVWSLDNQPGCAEILGQLGRVHRRYGVTAAHYKPFFTALRDTAQHFIGPAWTAETASAWQVALDYMSGTMRAAADEDARTSPPWRIGEIVSHELRSPGVAVIRLRPSDPLPYEAGQHVPVQVTRWPRAWRNYSIANAPRPGGLIELHVRAVPGGEVSNTLVYHSAVGDCVLLGAAAGAMTLADTDRDLLCIAGGTGLAPIKAIVEQVLAAQTAGAPTPGVSAQADDDHRKITLFFGARQHFDLYDLDDLQLLESACPALRVFPVLSEEPGYQGLAGLLPDVIGAQGLFEAAEAYICGPPAMVTKAAAVLAASIPPGQIHHDPLP
jgi:NAD(P)H-flavin reductase/hemoglobin-like flavoprotein